MAPHQGGARLDGEQGAEIAHVHLAVVHLLGPQDPLRRRLHQPLQPGILAMSGRLAQGDDGGEPGAGGRLAGGLDGGGEQPLAHPLLDWARRHGLLQLRQGQGAAAPVGGDLGAGAHLILVDQHEEPGILPLGYGHGRVGGGVRLGQQGVEQGDGLPDPLVEGLIASAVGEPQQGQDMLLLDGLGETRGNAQTDIGHVCRQLKPRFA
ncbi:hypothetical protein D3C73_933990 [compost metagenome]